MTSLEYKPYGDALVLSKRPHADYARVCDLARDYRRLATGKDLGALLQIYELRETPEEFKNRERLTIFTTPAVWSQLTKPLNKTARLRQGITKRFEWTDGVSDVDGKALRLNTGLDNYNGEQDLADYLAEVNSETVADTDPNAWILTEFKPFDFRREEPTPYPLIIPCEAAFDFTQHAGKFTSLAVRTKVAGQDRFTCYLENETIDYWPVIPVAGEPGIAKPSTPAGATVAWQVFDENGILQYEAVVLAHRAGRLPAYRVGYVPDKETTGRTCVSPLHYAAIYLRKSLKLGSEADIAAAQVVNPHKAQYALACPGLPDLGCSSTGRTMDGTVCTVCNGTHVLATQTGSADILQLPYPKDAEPKDIVDLSKLVVWNRPPTDILTFQQDLLRLFKEEAYQVMYNSEVLVKAGVATTGAEYLDRKAQENNTLAPYAKCLARQYKHHAYVYAAYMDLAAGLKITYTFPEDLRQRSEEELAATLESFRKAGVPAPVLEALSLELMRKTFVDSPSEVLKYQVKMQHTPFQGLSNEEVFKMRLVGDVSNEYYVLRFYQDSVFAEIEQDPKVGPSFYSMTIDKRKPIVDAAVKKIMDTLPTATTAAPTFRPATAAAAVA